MYRHFYNLTSRPFELSPDPKFLWLGDKYKEGLAAVRYGIRANAGFLSLTGDVGTGKTTLANALANSLANSLGDNIILAKIPEPYLETLDFFNFAANAFEMNKIFGTKGEFLIHFKKYLYNAHARHKKVLLIIEEAQRLSHALLEEVRLISNIEKQSKNLISILFVGQNKFNYKLKKNEALKQRVIISYHIQPLTEIETKAYIRHRLRIAGSETGIFSQGAIHEVYAFSKGNPLLINVVCDLALLSGYLKETKIIKPQIIKECAVEYEISNQKKAGSGFSILSDNRDHGQTPVFKPDNQAIIRDDIALLQSRLLDLKSQKAAGEMQLSRLQAGYDALVFELRELKSTEERVAKPENVIANKEQMLSRFEQKLNELEKHLYQEKNSKNRFSAQLVSQDALIAELQQKVGASQSNQLNIEDKIALLQSQLFDLKTKQTVVPTSPVFLKMHKKLPSEGDASQSVSHKKNQR
jgi:type II secretory pathway predicted ATPase ExeA